MIEFNLRNIRSWAIMGINPSIWSIGFPEIINNETTALLTADLARYSGLIRTAQKYPEIFYNFGIAEQNMVGIAAGMALCGHDVYMTTYAPFITYRCLDQFRHFLGNMNLNIKAIGSAAGLSAGFSGNALLAISDIAAVRSIPNLTILSPSDCTEAIKMMLALKSYNKPVYMRFCGTTNIPIVYRQDYEFEIGKAVCMQDGERIAIVATGTNMVYNALEVSNKIAEKYKFRPMVVNIHTIKPLDTRILDEMFKRFEIIYTIEEHNIIGGLGSAIDEYKSNKQATCRIINLGIKDTLLKLGNRDFMLDEAGLSVDKIFSIIEQSFLEQNKNDRKIF